MGENPMISKPGSFSLPPGSRFYPSEEQLLCYYLTHKNNNNDDHRLGFTVINDLDDLYNYNPFDLPDSTCFRFGRGGRRRHWYCYVAASRVLKEGLRRRAGGGYWKKSGQVREVVGAGAGKVVVGTRKRFVFYLRDSIKKASRTDWVMYEYAHQKASFILCRVFIRSRRRNNVSENVLSSCGEESVGTLRHIGIQHDGTIASAIGEPIVHDDCSVDRKNEVRRFPMGLVRELDNQITAGAVAVAGVQLPSSLHTNELVTTSGLTSGASLFIDGLASHHLKAILEDDFIELDDLSCPLSGIDFT